MPTLKEIWTSTKTKYKSLTMVMISLVLSILTIIAFSPIKDCGFINLDDGLYVYDNTYVQAGLTADGIKQAFSYNLVKKSANWHPVTWLSFMFNYQLFGLNPLGYHLVNLFLHLINTILLFLVLYRMTLTLWPSAFVAALFAVHPLHVESVAWVAEHKDVLSTFFWILTMGAYSYYVKSPGVQRYWLILMFFVFGLMAKPMLVTLPFVLLLMDYWPLKRFQKTQKPQTQAYKRRGESKLKGKTSKTQAPQKPPEVEEPAESVYQWSMIYHLLREKIPLFVLVILSCIITYAAQQIGGATQLTNVYPLVHRIGNAFVSYVTYIGKMIWPYHLAAIYPYPQELILWQVLGSILLLTVITLGVFKLFKKAPYLTVGWLWYLGTLIPVIGIVQVGSQAMADRYTYVPLIGLFIIVAWGVSDLLRKWKWTYRKEFIIGLSILSLLSLSIVTWKQVGYWKNNITLYDHILRVTTNNDIALNNRGSAYSDLRNYKRAIEDYDRAVEIDPHFIEAYHNRGVAYASLGNIKQAIEDYTKVIALKPDSVQAYFNRGNAYLHLGNFTQAIENYSTAITLKPDYLNAYYYRSIVYKRLGNFKQAIEDYNRIIALQPGSAETYFNRGVAYAILGNYKQAIEDYERAITARPDYVEAYNNKGNIYNKLGNYKQAIENYDMAIKIKPSCADPYFNRGLAYIRIGKNDQAIRDLKAAANLGNESAKSLLRSQGIH